MITEHGGECGACVRTPTPLNSSGELGKLDTVTPLSYRNEVLVSGENGMFAKGLHKVSRHLGWNSSMPAHAHPSGTGTLKLQLCCKHFYMLVCQHKSFKVVLVVCKYIYVAQASALLARPGPGQV